MLERTDWLYPLVITLISSVPHVEEGMIRWNTADGRVEVYDGASWGSCSWNIEALASDAEDLAISLAISLG